MMYSVTKRQPVEGGLCSRKDWTARLIFSATKKTTNVALVIWKGNFGWDWTRFTAWPHDMLRVDLENVEGNTAYSEYNLFSDMSENDKYKLIHGSYSGRTVISSLLF